MERRIKLDAAELVKAESTIYFSDGSYATCKDLCQEKDTIFVIAHKDGMDKDIQINVDQLLPFGADYYAFDREAFSNIPVSFWYSYLSQMLTEPTEYDISVIAHIQDFLTKVIRPAKMGKVSELQGKVRPGDVLYYIEDGKAYPTIVRNVKNNIAETIYMYDSLKISDCDKYNLDLNDGEIRHIATRNYPSIRHVLAEVEQNSAGNISGNIRPFLNEDVAAQMIDLLIKES